MGLGTHPPSSGPGLTSPPYTAAPVDHDYAKRKALQQRQQGQQQDPPQADGTVPVPGSSWGGALASLELEITLGSGVVLVPALVVVVMG